MPKPCQKRFLKKHLEKIGFSVVHGQLSFLVQAWDLKVLIFRPRKSMDSESIGFRHSFVFPLKHIRFYVFLRFTVISEIYENKAWKVILPKGCDSI